MSPSPDSSMRTDDLIEALATRLEPVSPYASTRWLAAWTGGGIAVSAALMLLWLGPRPDFMAATGTMMFWTKFLYTLAIGSLAFWLAERMGRPGTAVSAPARALQALVAAFVLIAAARYLTAAASDRHALLMGHSARLCPCYILALSTPVLIGAIVGMRRLAPTRPALAGFAAGLAAGGSAAFVYAFSCNESGMPFVALWYTLPVLSAGLIGALAGRLALRW